MNRKSGLKIKKIEKGNFFWILNIQNWNFKIKLRKMMRILICLITLLILQSSLSKRPMKLRVMLMMIRRIIFTYIRLKTGSTWFPLLIFLIFIGGILIIFIILCAVIPNEKRKKEITRIYSIILCTLIFSLRGGPQPTRTSTQGNIKRVLFRGGFFTIILILITIYFLVAITILKTIKNPLRLTLPCQNIY